MALTGGLPLFLPQRMILAGVLLLSVLLVALPTPARASSSSGSGRPGKGDQALGPNADECRLVADSFTAANLGPASVVPKQRVHDPSLEVCHHTVGQHAGQESGSDGTSHHKSCCNKDMEHRFVRHAEMDFYDVMKTTSAALKDTLALHAVHYQGEFLRLLAAAENRTDTLLGAVYKIPVRDRHSPLAALFADLTAYVRRRAVNVHDSVEKFFDELFPLVYHNLLNDPSVTTLDDDFRECLTSSRTSLNPRPFGDVPHRLSHTLSQALFSARTFLEALQIGIDAINTTEKIALEPQCIKSVARLRYCGQCGGHIGARPCRNFCYNVMRGCLATTAEMDRHWNEYVDALKLLQTYMQGSYNIEEVLRGVHTRVSEAIMHSMETGHKFYAKLIERCGHPKASSKRSKTPSTSTSLSAGTQNKTAAEGVTSSSTSSLLSDTRMESFMRSVMASKGFYHNLADTLCSDAKFATGLADQDHCWNGQNLGRYNKTLVAVDLEIQMSSNPEMTVTARRNNNIVNLIDRLIHIKKLLGSKISRELMQADQRDGSQRERYKYNRGRSSSRGANNHGPYYGSGDGGTQIDDEDYNNDFSGSGDGVYVGGSASGPTYEQPQQPQRPAGGNPGGPGDDIYIDEPSHKPPVYKGITQSPPGAQGVSGGATPSTMYVTSTTSLVLVVTSLLASLVTYKGSLLWLNG